MEYTVIVIDSLKDEIKRSDLKTQKLFEKQKRFMEINPHYNSLGRTKLNNVTDKYGRDLWEIRLDGKRRIVFIKKDEATFVWLKVCSHDELRRKNVINVSDNYLD